MMVARLKTFHNQSTPIHNVRVACDVKGFIGSFNGLLPPNGAPRMYRRQCGAHPAGPAARCHPVHNRLQLH